MYSMYSLYVNCVWEKNIYNMVCIKNYTYYALFFPLICISICYICIVAFKTLHKPYISERMFHLYFLLK
ncbi:hypothetical protein DW990_13560 [Phocaeicola vulgatus]|nr:hypothetical protein DW990_13560 [Phocaeicola vulgatus]